MRRRLPQFAFGLATAVACFVLAFIVGGVAHAEQATVNATVPAICGNGTIEGAETCDDGNTVSGDGCSNVCATEAAQEEEANNGDGGGGAIPAPPPPAPPPEPEPEPEPAPEEEVPAEEEVPVEEEAPAPEEEVPAEEEEAPAPEEDQGEDVAEQEGEDLEEAVGPQGGEDQGGAPVIGGEQQGQGQATGGGDPASSGGRPIRVGAAVSLEQFAFLIANRSIVTAPVDRQVSTLAGDTLTMSTDASNFGNKEVAGMIVSINGVDKRFSQSDEQYYADVVVPGPGIYSATIRIWFSDGEESRVTFSLISHGLGQVVDKKTGEPVLGARIVIQDVTNGVQWPAGNFFQKNPATVTSLGLYGFVVPNGTYKVTITAEGYVDSNRLSVKVVNHVLNKNYKLIPKAPSILGEIQNAKGFDKVGAALGATGKQISEKTQIAAEAVVDVVRKVDELADDPVIEEITEEVVAPSAVGVVTVTVVPSLWGSLLPFLRYVFLQPLLFVGRRKRKEWGVVYNALTKLPVDLAVVRLVDKKTGRIKMSRVTDANGRYLFIADPGEYTLEVTKQGFQFPSSVLRGSTLDGEFVDLYHGEAIEVSSAQQTLTPNIPMDPAGTTKTPKRIIWDKRLRFGQQVVAFSGIALAAAAFYVSPTPLVGGMLGLHLVMYFTFHKLVLPKKPTGWGIVYEEGTKKPLSNAVVRLFTKQYDKLVATAVTDRKGRYAFLVGPSTYFLRSEAKGYDTHVGEDIVLSERQEKGAVLKENVGMFKQGTTPASLRSVPEAAGYAGEAGSSAQSASLEATPVKSVAKETPENHTASASPAPQAPKETIYG